MINSVRPALYTAARVQTGRSVTKCVAKFDTKCDASVLSRCWLGVQRSPQTVSIVFQKRLTVTLKTIDESNFVLCLKDFSITPTHKLDDSFDHGMKITQPGGASSSFVNPKSPLLATCYVYSLTTNLRNVSSIRWSPNLDMPAWLFPLRLFPPGSSVLN